MFCPQCHAEYRPGFTRCSDCDVDLVQNLSEPPEKDPMATRGGTLVPLWEGEDLALHTSLLEELEAARIRYFDEPMGVFPGARRGDHFPIQPMTQFGYQVAVLSPDLASAREILERLLKHGTENIPIPPRDDQGDAISRPVPCDDEQATSEVWTGDGEKLANFLRDALRENDIVVRTEVVGTETRIYVPPSNEPRAREIVREIVEGEPPE